VDIYSRALWANYILKRRENKIKIKIIKRLRKKSLLKIYLFKKI